MERENKDDIEETLYRIVIGDEQQTYIMAPREKDALSVARRLYDRPKYDFDFGTVDIDVEDTGQTDIESAVRGDEPPFTAIVPHRYYMVRHEKRVNQAGYKGVYQTRLYY